MSAFGGKADIAQTCSDGLLLMLWTAPAPGHRNAVDCLSQAERFKEVRQATTVAFEVEGIGEDRRGNADKVDPGIGTTRVGQRIFTQDWEWWSLLWRIFRCSGSSTLSN